MDDFHAKCDGALALLGTESDAVLIVPPFAALNRPSLGVHLLQAAADQAGLRVTVLYANLLFATLSGDDLYDAICYGNYGGMWGERIFAATAFGLPPLGHQTEKLRVQIASADRSQDPEVTFEQLASLERKAHPFCSALGQRLAALRFPVVGATTTFHQTAASVALLAQVKRAKPEAITLIGGANCQGEMARGIASLSAPIDYIFSGECESIFPDFLRRAVAGEPLPPDRIVRGEPCFDMDSLPEPSFEDYFAQLDNALPSWRENKEVWLPYESSRGCWWGARQHCTFCGLNGETMAFRQKSPDRVIAGVRRLLLRYPSPRLGMADNILPHSYFRTVLPRLAKELPPVQIFYETKSNLNLEQVQLLRGAGVNRIQPGIEALSSSLLRRMKKGVLARQNLALLRYARASRVAVVWNLLERFPGDQHEDYDATLALIPLIHHLPPPTGVYSVSLDRFSPYFKDPDAYGIRGLEPRRGYAWAFPPSADLRSLAYHFEGEYTCAHSSDPQLSDSLKHTYRQWRDSWKAGSPAPTLWLTPGNDGYYTLMDTRGLEGTDMLQSLNEDEARTVLIGGPLDRRPLAQWAIERKLAVALDGWCVPLAVTNVETWRRFEAPVPRASVGPKLETVIPYNPQVGENKCR